MKHATRHICLKKNAYSYETTANRLDGIHENHCHFQAAKKKKRI